MKITGYLVVIGIQVVWCFEIKYRIMGGETVSDLDQAPYQVQYGRGCGGVLLSDSWAITAAHCSENHNFIVTGSLMFDEGTEYTICDHYTHPGWNATAKQHAVDYDFQLLRLCSPVPCCESRPAEIGQMEQVKEGATVVVTGWGYLDSKSPQMRQNLRKVEVPVVSQEECGSIQQWMYRGLTPRMFCAGFPEGAKDACQGDSGGPATIYGKVVGLVSFGVGCGMKERPGVYANLPAVRDWVQNVTELPL